MPVSSNDVVVIVIICAGFTVVVGADIASFFAGRPVQLTKAIQRTTFREIYVHAGSQAAESDLGGE